MNSSELFDLWAPPAAVWSRWAKPVLFADLNGVVAADPGTDPLPQLNTSNLHAGDVSSPSGRTALVIDLPSAASVKTGLALLKCGFRPVPLFNGARGPRMLTFATTILDNEPILSWLAAGVPLLAQHNLPFDAPPAFLIDSRRRTQVTASPGRFDNRWIVFPQDFPSASFLRAQGIARVILIQEDVLRQPQEDLAHVLRRWQEAGLPLFVASLDTLPGPSPLLVQRPSRFRSLCYVALAVMGLRRNSAGGFGSIVPQPSSG